MTVLWVWPALTNLDNRACFPVYSNGGFDELCFRAVALLLIHRSWRRVLRTKQDGVPLPTNTHNFHGTLIQHPLPYIFFNFFSFIFPLTWWLPLFYRPNCPWGGSVVVVVSLVFVIKKKKKSLVLNSQASYFPGVLSYSLGLEATQWF